MSSSFWAFGDGSFHVGQLRQAALTVRFRGKASIFVRKTLQVRPRDQKCICIFKLAGQDLRFSMKMMFAPDPKASLQPV
jgi:hypothetical protein